MKGFDDLIKAARLQMGPTRAIRLANAHKRSKAFNHQCVEDFEAMRVTPELLSRRCTL